MATRGPSRSTDRGPSTSRYASVAIACFNTFLVFVALNLLLWGLWTLRDRTPRSQKLAQYGADRLLRAYPGWTRETLTEFLLEDDTVSEYESYTEFRPKPRTGRFVNITTDGFRQVERQRPWPPAPDALSVFVFGGSTTFGAGVSDAQTIPSRVHTHLEARGCGPVAVYNFGRPQYFSTQERVLFQQLIAAGFVPKVAIFLDGLNDFYHWRGVPHWTDAIRGMVEHANGRGGLWTATVDLARRLPLGRAAATLARVGAGRARDGTDADKGRPAYDDVPTLHQAIARWATNKRLNEAIARTIGIRTVFVWQPVPTYRYDLSQHVLAGGELGYFGGHQRSRYGYALMARLRRTLGLDPGVLWLDGIQEGRKENLYVDSVHYTAPFSDEIATRIVDHLQAKVIGPCPR
ncbi:MAG: SGNH/GDSL hydrolase family protein [Candidatus Rokuibacteriota bacterium]